VQGFTNPSLTLDATEIMHDQRCAAFKGPFLLAQPVFVLWLKLKHDACPE
jgi:hypothetical protein